MSAPSRAINSCSFDFGEIFLGRIIFANPSAFVSAVPCEILLSTSCNFAPESGFPSLSEVAHPIKSVASLNESNPILVD